MAVKRTCAAAWQDLAIASGAGRSFVSTCRRSCRFMREPGRIQPLSVSASSRPYMPVTTMRGTPPLARPASPKWCPDRRCPRTPRRAPTCLKPCIAGLPLCLTQRASWSSSLAEVMMVAAISGRSSHGSPEPLTGAVTCKDGSSGMFVFWRTVQRTTVWGSLRIHRRWPLTTGVEQPSSWVVQVD